MAERSEWVEGEEVLDEYKDGEIEVANDIGDHGRDGDAERSRAIWQANCIKNRNRINMTLYLKYNVHDTQRDVITL